MEIEESVVSGDTQEDLESSYVDVVDVETHDALNSEPPLQEESPPERSTSTEVVHGKENQPPEKKRIVRLPLSRVKQIMKMDPEVSIVGSEAVFLVTKAAELFLEYLGRESAKYTLMSKRKTVQRRDIDAAIDSVAHLCFLEGALE